MFQNWQCNARELARREKERELKKRERFESDARLGEREYTCVICGKEASSEVVRLFGYGYAYNPPRGFSKCRLCHEWTCSTCQEQGICRSCARTAMTAGFLTTRHVQGYVA